ncbi:MAG: dihydroxyacetone kinase subunit DhaL, partial [Dongiaceae bacterium]
MSDDLTVRLVAAAVSTIREHAEELTALDRAIGDGDHGLNMRRGFDAIAEAGDAVTNLPLPAALEKIGMTLVMKVGGASGPLYGSLFMAMGKAGAEAGAPDGIAAMLAQGIDAVKKRGKSTTGEKTMLDVL